MPEELEQRKAEISNAPDLRDLLVRLTRRAAPPPGSHAGDSRGQGAPLDGRRDLPDRRRSHSASTRGAPRRTPVPAAAPRNGASGTTAGGPGFSIYG